MITIYTDKEQLFECQIKIEGTEYSKVQSRLIISPTNSSKHLFIEGIVENNICKIKIPPINEISKNGAISLEIIVDNNLFNPWQSNYELTTEKKLTVENVQIDKTNNVSVSITDVKSNSKKYIKEEKQPKKKVVENIDDKVSTVFDDVVKNAVKKALKENSK